MKQLCKFYSSTEEGFHVYLNFAQLCQYEATVHFFTQVQLNIQIKLSRRIFVCQQFFLFDNCLLLLFYDDGGGGDGVGGDEGCAEDYSDLCPCFALLAPPPPPPLMAPLLLVRLSRQSPPPRTQTRSTVLKWRHISFCSICMFWKCIYNRDSLHICFKRRIQPAAGLSPTRHLVGGQIICKTEFVPCTCKHKDILCEQTQRYFVQAQTQPQTQQLQLPEQL